MNEILSEMCEEKNIYLIEHSWKIESHHLNRGKLHLNKKGIKKGIYGLINTFVK